MFGAAQMLRFRMEGSKGDVYDVGAERSGGGVRITCTCQAAENGIHCHHRIELLRGDVTALVSDNPSDVAKLQALIAGTDLAAALEALTVAEAAQAAAKAIRDRWMHALDRLMQG
jgi:hypothetical protein